MEISFRQLQRMTARELQRLTESGDVIVTIDSQPSFVLTGFHQVDSQPNPHTDSQAKDLSSLEEELPDF